jgi:hypothetical protein
MIRYLSHISQLLYTAFSLLDSIKVTGTIYEWGLNGKVHPFSRLATWNDACVSGR